MIVQRKLNYDQTCVSTKNQRGQNVQNWIKMIVSCRRKGRKEASKKQKITKLNNNDNTSH